MKQAINFLPHYVCGYCGKKGHIFLYRHTNSENQRPCYTLECSACVTSGQLCARTDDAIESFREGNLRGFNTNIMPKEWPEE